MPAKTAMFYEVTVEFPTALFEVSSLTIGVASMADVVDLQDAKRQTENKYRFASYRSIRATDLSGVLLAIEKERAAQEEIALGTN